MLLKRIFKDGKLDHLKVMHFSDEQNFSTKFVDQGLSNGTVSISGDTLEIKSDPPLSYKIIRRPGYYCCYDDKPVSGREEALKYIEDNFKGIQCPDKENPSGYRKDNFYYCRLEV